MPISIHYLAKLGFPALICIFALAYKSTIDDAPRAARLFPDGLIWLLVTICVIEMARATLRQWRSGDGQPAAIVIGLRQFAVLVAMAAFYPAVLMLGFAVPSVLFLFAVSLLCGATVKQAALVTVIAAACVYLFVTLSGFDLPLF
jgi:hypothetical protein